MDYSIKPEEHELREARQTIHGVIESCKATMPKQENLKINLGWTEDEFVKGNMGGTTGLTYSYKQFEIEFNTSADNWKSELKSTAAHEYSHTWFYEELGNKKYEDIQFIWQHLLMEAHAQLFAEKVTGKESRMKDEVRSKKLEVLWPELKEKLGEGSETHREFFVGQEELPMWSGYSLAYHIGQKLLEEYELEEFPELNRSDVVDAGDELFS